MTENKCQIITVNVPKIMGVKDKDGHQIGVEISENYIDIWGDSHKTISFDKKTAEAFAQLLDRKIRELK